MNDLRKLKQIDDAIERAEQTGVSFESKLRGRYLCCNDPANIEFLPVKVDGTFKLHRRDHFENLKKQARHARCKVCQTKYWSSADRKVLMERI